MCNAAPNLKRLEEARALLDAAGQSHLLGFWGELSADQREHLLAEVGAVPWASLEPALQRLVIKPAPEVLPEHLEPAPVYPWPPQSNQIDTYQEASERGRRLLEAGRVAAFTVAGGQGTRLGFDGPKGTLVVTPTGGLSLFALFAEMIKAARAKYSASIPWYVLTSPANHDQSVAYFKEHRYFGLPEADVSLFPQGMLPAFDLNGRALLEEKHRLALSPDGHGGSLKALHRSGSLADMRARNIDVISYFQVDNPLAKPFDPLFLGLHEMTESEMSVKVTPKADDLERMGNVCLRDGKLVVVEYSDFPESYAHLRDENGRRKFDAGNLAIHLLNPSFVERTASEASALPYRRAVKAVAFVDDQGSLQQPTEPNAVKLETFVFDALPLARSTMVLQVDRLEEFSPVKSATGVDSLESARRDQNRRACRWLEEVGVSVPRTSDGEPNITVTIAPTFALEPDDLILRKHEIPELRPGSEVYIG